MELKHKLLEHPFYQAWTMGEVTPEQLSAYHKSYTEFIEEVPKYWTKIAEAFGQTEAAQHIIDEETAHIDLWTKWQGKLPEVNSFPRMKNVLSSFANMTPSELLGAVHAFEIQQPGVAQTKKDGLLKWYGFNEGETIYFDEHIAEEDHIQFGTMLANNFANKEEFARGFDKGAELVYNGLDLFVAENYKN